MNQQKVNAPFFAAMHPEKFAKRVSKFWRKEGRIDMKLENYPGAVCGTHDCDAV